ncbi:MAG: DUF6089 family protein [Bacteroidota bacterium]
MKKFIVPAFFTLAVLCNASAQERFNPNELQGAFGVTFGAAHYFGDLNTRAALNRPKIALGAFYSKQFNNYLSARLSIHYAQLGYSDKYSKSDYQKQRNLSFNTDILEIALSADFNFFKFQPGEPGHNFTPYLTLGLGLFSYNPYAYLNSKIYYLRPLGTEGQNIGYEGRKPYGSMSMCVPIGMGIKYNVNNKFNISFQIAQRLTFSDYLDDVSTTFVGADKFVNPTALALQDRSYEKGTTIGLEGRQRGWSKQKDQYVIAEIGISFNISSYRCPSDFQ